MTNTNKPDSPIREQEGVIKYELIYSPQPIDPSFNHRQLTAWRRILHRLQLIGQDPNRYGGLGFGNISQRLATTKPNNYPFIISGTQTGNPEILPDDQFCIVENFSLGRNRIEARGPVRPSSEALTHAAIFESLPAVQIVMHVHNPEIWRAAAILGIPVTGEQVPYGTPDMAYAVQELVSARSRCHSGIFAMLGHEDGIVAYGATAKEAGNLLVDSLASAMALDTSIPGNPD